MKCQTKQNLKLICLTSFKKLLYNCISNTKVDLVILERYNFRNFWALSCYILGGGVHLWKSLSFR